jgi:hypothetical protein
MAGLSCIWASYRDGRCWLRDVTRVNVLLLGTVHERALRDAVQTVIELWYLLPMNGRVGRVERTGGRHGKVGS